MRRVNIGPVGALAEQIAVHDDDLASLMRRAAAFAEGRLWCQFGDAALTLQRRFGCETHGTLAGPDAQPIRSVFFATLFENIVEPAIREVNPVMTALLASSTALELGHEAGEAFLQRVAAAFEDPTLHDPLRTQAVGCVYACMARIKIEWREKELADKLLSKAREALDASKILVHRSVYAVFYETVMTFHKAFGPAELYYAAAMSFLRVVPLKAMPKEEAVSHIKTIMLSAIVAENFYDFNELVSFDLVHVLAGSPVAFLDQLIRSFAEGDAKTVHAVIEREQDAIKNDPDLHVLAHMQVVIEDKLPILRLLSVVVKKELPCVMTYDEIVQELDISSAYVEILLFRAVSLQLCEVSIDQVDERVTFVGVRPMLLDTAGIKNLEKQTRLWVEAVEDVAHEVVTSSIRDEEEEEEEEEEGDHDDEDDGAAGDEAAMYE